MFGTKKLVRVTETLSIDDYASYSVHDPYLYQLSFTITGGDRKDYRVEFYLHSSPFYNASHISIVKPLSVGTEDISQLEEAVLGSFGEIAAKDPKREGIIALRSRPSKEKILQFLRTMESNYGISMLNVSYANVPRTLKGATRKLKGEE